MTMPEFGQIASMNHPQKLICDHPDQWDDIAATLLAAAGDARVFCLSGDLGAGKTTMVRSLVKALGSRDAVSSPTYVLAQHYAAPDLHPPVIHHIDAYRLTSVEEVPESGIPDFLADGAWCFVEWPAILEEWLPDHFLEVHIKTLPDNKREIVYLTV
jgi:tRNA threonylcarbamoyladenosine biosynthesis protein TsaE